MIEKVTYKAGLAVFRLKAQIKGWFGKEDQACCTCKENSDSFSLPETLYPRTLVTSGAK
jgi:hypothetical protein